MSAFNIASRYANAFYQFSESKGLLEQLYADIKLLEDSFSGSKELRAFLASPVIKQEKKEEILEAIFKQKISKNTWEFLIFILKKGRETYILEIVKRLNQIKNEKLGIVEALIQTNYQIDENDSAKFKSKLEDYTNKKVLIKHKINEAMTGGFVARIGDTVIDATIESQLLKLKKKLIENINS